MDHWIPGGGAIDFFYKFVQMVQRRSWKKCPMGDCSDPKVEKISCLVLEVNINSLLKKKVSKE